MQLKLISHIVTHTYIPVASNQLNSNEVYKKHNEENINLVIVLIHDKFHQYCMQLHKYTKNNFNKIVYPFSDPLHIKIKSTKVLIPRWGQEPCAHAQLMHYNTA